MSESLPESATPAGMRLLTLLVGMIAALGIARFAGRLIGLLALLVIVLATIGALAAGILVLHLALR